MEGTALETELTDQGLDAITNRVLSQGQLDPSVEKEAADGAAEGVLTDEYGLPFEPEGYYNSAPLQFEEMAQVLWTVTNNIHYTATRYNRHSPYYMVLLNRLEKNIRQMGSVCITKAVLEQSGEKFTKLDPVSLHELYCMVSLHFRKCVIAYNDVHENERSQDMSLAAWLFRLAALAERLKATEDKIQKIKEGKITLDSMIDRARVYNKEPRMRRDNSGNTVNPRLRASALPIMKSYAKEIKRRKQELEKQEKRKQRESERAARRLERGGIIKPGSIRLTGRALNKAGHHTPDNLSGIGMDTEKLKSVLIEDAVSREDYAEAVKIVHEEPDKLMERYKNLREQGRAIDQMSPSAAQLRDIRTRSGPSAENRKKLREKRKKKK